MLNIEKYKEELENIGVLNPNRLAVINCGVKPTRLRVG